jgi:hypothetical protein
MRIDLPTGGAPDAAVVWELGDELDPPQEEIGKTIATSARASARGILLPATWGR